MEEEGYAIDDFVWRNGEIEIPWLLPPVRWNPILLLEAVKRPVPVTDLEFVHFLQFPVVHYSVLQTSHGLYERLCAIQWPDRVSLPAISGHDLIDAVKYCHGYNSRFNLALFLLPYVRTNPKPLWKGQSELVHRKVWWYLLFQRARRNGWHLKCIFTSRAVNASFDEGRAIWERQKSVALAVFVCVRHVYGSRDMGQLIATLIMKMQFLFYLGSTLTSTITRRFVLNGHDPI